MLLEYYLEISSHSELACLAEKYAEPISIRNLLLECVDQGSKNASCSILFKSVQGAKGFEGYSEKDVMPGSRLLRNEFLAPSLYVYDR